MMLSPHFSLAELTITQVRGVGNTPSADVIEHLGILAAGLEEVRALLGRPVLVNSGYRCPEVNARVGGVPNSAHLQGFAADFICPAFGPPLDVCRAIAGSGLSWDQCIEEGTWVHLSFAPTLREAVLTKRPGGGYDYGLTRHG